MVRQPLLQHLEQALGLDGFGHEVVHPRVQAALAVFGHGVGGHGHDRQLGPLGLAAYPLGRGQAVHHRHLHVHEHQVVVGSGEAVERKLAVARDVHVQAVVAQQFAGHLLVDLVVFHQQHAGAMQARMRAVARCRRGSHQARATVAVEHLQHGVQQGGGIDRLGQHGGDALLAGVVEYVLAAIGGHQHQPGRLAQGQLRQAAGHFQPVHARHLPVEQHHLERLAEGIGPGDSGQRGVALGAALVGKGQGIELLFQRLDRTLVVVHHQHTAPGQLRAREGSGRAHRALAKAGGEPEG